jgi:hypothetical protein
MNDPVRGTLIDKSPTNERDNSRTHSAGIGCLLSSVKILFQERVLSLYVRLMIKYVQAAESTANISVMMQWIFYRCIDLRRKALRDLSATFWVSEASACDAL